MASAPDVIAVCVCIQYSDYLAETLPHNRPLFRSFYIITEASDTKTVELATTHDCVVLYTTKTHENGAAFNFSGMMFDAQTSIHPRHPDSWIVKLDADIYVPDTIWTDINVDSLNKNGVYGLIRHVYNTIDDYKRGAVSCIDKGDVGVVGYFQLYWNKRKYYPKWSRNCSNCDLVFMRDFPIQQTFPIVCFHFGEKRKNWNGRATEVWSAGVEKI
jgi:hypothetical protein